MSPLSRLLQLNDYFLSPFTTNQAAGASTSLPGKNAFLRAPLVPTNQIGSDVESYFGSDFGNDFGSNLSKNIGSDFGDDPFSDITMNSSHSQICNFNSHSGSDLNSDSSTDTNSNFSALDALSVYRSAKNLLKLLQTSILKLLRSHASGNIDSGGEESPGADDDVDADIGRIGSGAGNSGGYGGSNWGDYHQANAAGGNSGKAEVGGNTTNLVALPSNGSLTALDMGPGGDTTGSQTSNPGNWYRRSGKNDDPAFSSYFDPSMVNGNTIAIQGSQGSEVNDSSINPNRGAGTYYYSSKKNAADGIVQSGFLYGNGRKFEVDFDELDFGNPADTNTQMASVYINNDKKVEAKYKASDLGFKNFSDQTMHFRAVIKEGHVSVQALNSQGNWQQITELSNGTINSGTMRETDFKPFMSTWRMSGRPDDGQRHEMTGEMSFTPG